MSPREEMSKTIGALLDGSFEGSEAQAWLASLDIHRITAEDLAGAADAVMSRAVAFPEWPTAVDCCGTGGDGRSTYNISTAAAIVAAACGVKVAKHGNRAVTSNSGSADVLGALGVNTLLEPEESAKMLDQIGLCFLYAPTFHPGFKRLSAMRAAIGHRTIFNLLGPLCNPARVRRQLLGVFALPFCYPMIEACKLLGREHVMVVHGEDGTDEISVTGATQAYTLMLGHIKSTRIIPESFGMHAHPGRTLVGGTAQQNARAMRDVFEGIESPYTDAVLINTAGLLEVAGVITSIEEGIPLARNAISKGDASRKLTQLIEASGGHA